MLAYKGTNSISSNYNVTVKGLMTLWGVRGDSYACLILLQEDHLLIELDCTLWQVLNQEPMQVTPKHAAAESKPSRR